MMKNKLVVYFEDGGMEDCIEFTDWGKFDKFVKDVLNNQNLIITKVE